MKAGLKCSIPNEQWCSHKSTIGVNSSCMFQTTCLNRSLKISVDIIDVLKVKTSLGNPPLSKNEMEALITNRVKEYVLTNT